MVTLAPTRALRRRFSALTELSRAALVVPVEPGRTDIARLLEAVRAYQRAALPPATQREIDRV